MLLCACAVGNSSAPIREGAFLGVPAVNIGTRQTRPRPRAERAGRAATTAHAIVDGHPPPARARPLPVGSALRRRRAPAARIADVLATRAARRCRSAWCSRSRPDADARGHSGARRVEGRAGQEPAPARRPAAAGVHGRRGARQPAADAHGAEHRRSRRLPPPAARSASTCRSCGRRRWPPTTRRCCRCCSTPCDDAGRAAASRADAVVLLQPTSPLRRAEHIDAARRPARRRAAPTRWCSVVEVPHQFSPVSVMRSRRPAAAVHATARSSRAGRTSRACYARNGPAVLAVRAGVARRAARSTATTAVRS